MLPGRPVQLQGSRLAAAVLRLGGWHVRFDGLPALQGVMVVYPHTSNWDFILGVLSKWAIGLPVAFWGKDTLFRWPLFGRWLRRLGGLPLVRDSGQGVVGPQRVEGLLQRGVALRGRGRRGRARGLRGRRLAASPHQVGDRPRHCLLHPLDSRPVRLLRCQIGRAHV